MARYSSHELGWVRRLRIVVLFMISSLVANSQTGRNRIPDKLVVLTFDDATASQYAVVAPLLRQYGFNATFFVCEFPPNFKDDTKYMTWSQIKELEKMGFEIGNHTRTHALLTRLDVDEFNAQVHYIEEQCAAYGIKEPLSFAYPGYDCNQVVLDRIKGNGYAFARAGGSRAYDPMIDHPLLIPSWFTTAKNRNQIMEAISEAKDGKVVVLTIHGVPDVEHPWVSTPPELFNSYMTFLHENGYKVIALSDLARYVDVEEAMKVIKPDFQKKYRF